MEAAYDELMEAVGSVDSKGTEYVIQRLGEIVDDYGLRGEFGTDSVPGNLSPVFILDYIETQRDELKKLRESVQFIEDNTSIFQLYPAGD